MFEIKKFDSKHLFKLVLWQILTLKENVGQKIQNDPER